MVSVASPTATSPPSWHVDLSVAAAHVLGETGAFEGHRPVAVVGRDPRASGEFLEAAVVAGLASAGVDVATRGRPADARRGAPDGRPGADLGVMLSASHNAMPDNGIKFFARGGHKLGDAIEDAVESTARRAVGPPDRSGGRSRDRRRRWRRRLRRAPALDAR